MGRETARLLAEAEARVAVADLNEDSARETAAAIEAAGGRAWATKLDVSDSAAVDAAVSAAAEALGPIDALVNIAGIYQVAEVQDITDADWARMFSVHVNGTFHTCRAVLPGMMAARRGAIVNMSSLHAQRGQGGDRLRELHRLACMATPVGAIQQLLVAQCLPGHIADQSAVGRL